MQGSGREKGNCSTIYFLNKKNKKNDKKKTVEMYEQGPDASVTAERFLKKNFRRKEKKSIKNLFPRI